MYDRWLLEDNFARISAIEVKLQKLQMELSAIRVSNEQIRAKLPPPPPSSPVTRQVASPDATPAIQIADNTSPHYPFSSATVDMINNFGM